MKYSFYPKIFCLSIFIIFASAIRAQVTIGSGLKPRMGALLDVKEFDSNADGTTATRGIGLPRVSLSDISKLKIGDADELIGNDRAAHVGLLVFNTYINTCGANAFDKGMYVWDSEKWVYLGKESGYASEVKRYKDQEGNTFKARKFGEAGIWMIENLAVKYFADDLSNEIPLHTMNSNYDPQYAYPSEKPNGWDTPSATGRQDGLLYNWSAAAKMYPSALNQQQVPGDIPGEDEIEKVEETSLNAYDGKIQGICPNGWHLPTDREWNQLEAELYNNAPKYSLYTNEQMPLDPTNPKWNRDWDTELRDRGSLTDKGHGIVMKSPCFAPFYPESLGAARGGFDAILAGLVAGRTAITYGDYAYFWTASTKDQVASWYRYFATGEPAVFRHNSSDYNLFSVRCKKDTSDY